MEKEELLRKLNPGQRAAVEYNAGPLLVIAGAGSGKTRVLTFKIAYLIQLGYNPWNILALTFTNKAANEMKSRIGRLVGDRNAHQINMGTFHSVFSRILRIEAEAIGFTSQFTIYDENDSRNLLKTIIKEMGLDDKMYKPASVHNRISMAKNNIISAHQYINDAELFERDRSSRMPAVGKIFLAYQQRCRTANVMDFDDLLVMTYNLFQSHDDIRKKWADKFRYILVDEYQDTNKVQQMIVEQLSKENQKVCVVGDDAQSIYAFRGANIDNILNFNNIYPNSKLFKLERNYRSTQKIVQAANSLIKHNERQIHKDVFSENDEGDSLLVKFAYSDREEAAIVCRDIKRYIRKENGIYSDFAILYRTNAQSRTFEEECLKQNIPYKIYGGVSFYQRKEIKDVIAYFRLVCNVDDEEAFKRIINYPTRGIGNTTLAKISNVAQKFGVSFWEVSTNPDKYGLNVNAGTKNKLVAFSSMISSFKERLRTTDALTLGKEIVFESGIQTDLYSSTAPEYISRQENVQEFISGMESFTEDLREEGREQDATLDRFLQEVSLLTDRESDDNYEPKVAMMTVHAAKGLEFPTVFIVGMEENIFPSQMALSSPRELEEERRLLYVAITRAEKHCILTCAKNRWRYSKMEYFVPSRFLYEIDSRFIRFDGDSDYFSSSAGMYSNMSRKKDSSEIHKPYKGNTVFGKYHSEYNDRVQNSHPVATQFKADVEYKITSPRDKESPADPLSPAFRMRLNAARNSPYTPKGARAAGFRQATDKLPTNFKRVKTTEPKETNIQANTYQGLREGVTIEHLRFGIGTVVKIEGTGENIKATVDFRNTGTKQLLLKFAKFNILK
jgi:DNA helicase-2/ATP-dependent DNA helicase PcrA